MVRGLGNNSQRSHTPLKTAQQAPHQGSFEKEMSKERKAHSRSRRSHISKLLILFFKVIHTLLGIKGKGAGKEKEAGRLSVPVQFFGSAELSTCERRREKKNPVVALVI